MWTAKSRAAEAALLVVGLTCFFGVSLVFGADLSSQAFAEMASAEGEGSNPVQKEPFASMLERQLASPNPPQFSVVFRRGDAEAGLSEPVLDNLRAVAHEQASDWGDTILGGDYEVDGVTHLELVESVTRNQELIAYHIVYSQAAWSLDQCTHAVGAPHDGCKAGRIQEASFVAPDFRRWTRDEMKIATFF